MRTGNPVLKENSFRIEGQATAAMTLDGVVNKSAFLLGLVFLSAYYVWDKFFSTLIIADITPFIAIGFIGGFIVAMVTVFKPNYAMITAPLYAILEGLALGGLSAFMESSYPGIVIQAVSLTFAVFFSLLIAYRSGLIKVTENFKLMVVAATGGIAFVYIISFVLGFFGISVPFIHDSGIFGIGFSLFVVAIAAMNLVLDFDFIERGVENGAPKFMEWYASFGLIVTLVWLYIEILRLLSKLRR